MSVAFVTKRAWPTLTAAVKRTRGSAPAAVAHLEAATPLAEGPLIVEEAAEVGT